MNSTRSPQPDSRIPRHVGHNGAMKGTPEATLNDIAAELYVVPPGQFVSARKARADEVSDSDLATQVRALRKPLLAAWVVNLFAREHSDELGQALDLAEQLQEAQRDLDARALSALSRQRRALVHGLATKAGELATARGEHVTSGTLEAVEQTLNAAMFDVAAAAAVASGRLVRPLEASGGFPGALDDVVAGVVEKPGPRRPASVDEVRARRERKDAERAVREAEKVLAQAERRRDEAERKWQEASTDAERLREQTQALEAELSKVAERASTVQAVLVTLTDERAAAADAAAEAERTATEARARLDR